MVNVDEFIQLSDEMVDFCIASEKIDHSLEVFSALNETIRVCGGVSESLEMMFGENFTCAASMEAEAVAEEDGWWKRLWNWFKDFFARCWAWLKSWFQTRDGMIKNLNELKAKANQVKYPVRVPLSFTSVIKAQITRNYFEEIRHGDIDDITKAGWLDSVGRILGLWGEIKAKFVKDMKEYEMVTDPSDLTGYIENLIEGLNISKYVSENYKNLSEEIGRMAELGGSSKTMSWIKAKSHLIHLFLANQSFFRILIRCGNLLLQRAKTE